MQSLETSVLSLAAVFVVSCVSAQHDDLSGYRFGEGVVALVHSLKEGSEEACAPTLRLLQGRVPLARVSQRPSDARADQPSFEFAVFDDGTVVYEGDRCVRLGGLIIKRLKVDDIRDLGDFLTESCTFIPSAVSDEVCIERPTVLRLTCSNGKNTFSATDRCARDSSSHAAIEALARELLKRVGANEWLGEPTDRQTCGAGNRGLAPGKLRATLQSR
jgi:hypothetical protein